MSSITENSEVKLKEIIEGVNSLLNKRRQFNLGRLKTKSRIVGSESELKKDIQSIVSECGDLESWCMFSDKITQNCLPLEDDRLLKLQEAELHSRSKKKTLKIKRIGSGGFVVAEYTTGTEGEVMAYQIQSVCVRQDIASRDGHQGRVWYALWYREDDKEKGKIVPYLQQFIGFKEV